MRKKNARNQTLDAAPNHRAPGIKHFVMAITPETPATLAVTRKRQRVAPITNSPSASIGHLLPRGPELGRKRAPRRPPPTGAWCQVRVGLIKADRALTCATCHKR